MSKITYYLGAGASFNSCPILDKQAEMMILLAKRELYDWKLSIANEKEFEFTKDELKIIPKDNKLQILWHIGYYGKKAIEFNTIDTYARKLSLNGEKTELNLLKMSVSVFFDLWENFHERYNNLEFEKEKKKVYKSIDHRYLSLFSVLLESNGSKIKINNSFKFVSWNYDLQLETAFSSFLRDKTINNLEDLNQFYFSFMEENSSINDVYHLNGHRGFFEDKDKNNFIKKYQIKTNNSIEEFWDGIHWLYDSVIRNKTNFHKYIKYAWEHDLNSDWFKGIIKVMQETEVLVIIGYSFPPFNREIDQYLFSKLNLQNLKKIVYQDPNANSEIIENLFVNPLNVDDKIIIEKGNLNQFYIPNEHFITQRNSIEIR